MKSRWPNHKYQKENALIQSTKDLRIVIFHFTIYLLCTVHSYLETNQINPWNSINIWFWLNYSDEKNHHQCYDKISEWKVTSEHSSSVLCLKLIRPQHQRHLLLKGRTNAYMDDLKFKIKAGNLPRQITEVTGRLLALGKRVNSATL